MKSFFCLATIVFFVPSFVLAYSEKTTHPALSDEIIDFFNYLYPESALTAGEKEYAKKGSTDEDDTFRYFNHFYDPVRNVGLLSLNPTSKRWAISTQLQDNRKNLAGVGILLGEYFGGATDYSWERAIFDYAHGDKERALRNLGHILHLIQDATVPDHTRDDPHPPLLELGSPYEAWAAQWTPENLDIAREFIAQNERPVLLGSLEEYFDAVAGYSNGNFFSKDTILNDRYLSPQIIQEKTEFLTDNKSHLFGFNSKNVRLVEIEKRFDFNTGQYQNTYKILDEDRLILSDYWRLLSRQAVLNGAGVVKLFFDEVGKEKQTLALLEKHKSILTKLTEAAGALFAGAFGGTQGGAEENRSTGGAAMSAATVLVAADALANLTLSARENAGQAAESADNHYDNRPVARETPAGTTTQEEHPDPVPSAAAEVRSRQTLTQTADTLSEMQKTPAPAPATSSSPAIPNAPSQAELPGNSPREDPPPREALPYFQLSPAGGGGGGVTNPPAADSPQTNAKSTKTGAKATSLPPAAPADATAPNAPNILSPANNATLTNASALFSGTAEASSTISTDFSSATTSAAAADGAWSLSLVLAEGTTTIQFFATDDAGNRSSAATTTVFVDSIAPSISLSVAECASSLSADSCLVAATTLSLSFSSAASDVSYFTLALNGTVSTTTATSTTVSVQDRNTHTVAVSATDTSGNRSATSTKAVTVHTLPVVVNEIAWAGTDASGADEWIELKNNTGETVSLSGFTLYAGDLSPYLPLSGSVAPNGYYLIERKNSGETNENIQSSVIGVSADLWTSFGVGLNNNGENMTLAFKNAGGATTTIDSVPTCMGLGPKWCAGDDSNYKTMERYDSLVSGSVQTNWYSHLGEFIQNGKDADGALLNGTPRARNSVSHLIAPQGTVASDKTLSAADSPYLVGRTSVTVAAGATLTLDPGVVVKIVSPNEPWIRIAGTIRAEGTAGQPVVFTAFADDDYGGDLNGDATSTSPVPGSWRRILIDTTSVGSSFTHTLIRYGGNNNSVDPAAKTGAVGVDGAAVTFDNLTVEKSGFHGLALQNSGSTVTRSRFASSTNSSVASSGVFVSGGSPSITESIFSGNYRGITLENATSSLSNNTVNHSSDTAVYASGILGSFSGNSGEGNGVNAIVIGNGTTVTQSGATTTLEANGLPYLVKGRATVAPNSVLSFGTGTVVKGHDTTGGNQGEIEAPEGARIHSGGSSTGDLIFTSLRDSAAGGATAAGLSAPAPGDWIGITIKPGGQAALSGFTLKYAGQRAQNPFSGESAGALKITGSAATSSGSIAHALFEDNYQSGLNLESTSVFSVSDATFQNHTEKNSGFATGVYFSGSAASLTDITFSGNERDAVGAGANALTCVNCGSPHTTPAGLLGP